MAVLPNLSMSLASRAENVLLVRETLAGVGEAIGLDGVELNDVRTAVTEACNNVVLHAYPGGEGPLEVEVYAPAGALEVVVRDRGIGVRPRYPGAAQGTSGIGVPVIQALARRVEVRSAPQEGTEVRMDFPAPSHGSLEPLAADALHAQCSPVPADTVEIAIAPVALANTIMPRLVCTLAIRARFPLDAISDAELVADALAEQMPHSVRPGRLSIGLEAAPRALRLRIGPLRRGRTKWRPAAGDASPGAPRGASRGEAGDDPGTLAPAAAVTGLGPVVERLTSERALLGSAPCEALSLQLGATP